MDHALPYVMAACTILSMLVTSAVWITLMSFKRGQREADFVTRNELNKVEERIAATYARSDVTTQRIDILEDRIAEVRKDLKDGIARILDHIDRTKEMHS